MWRKTTGSKECRSQDLSFISSADAPAVSPTQKACNAVALQHPLLTHSISSLWRLEENLNRVRIELTSHYLFLLSGALYIANVNSSFPNRRPLDQENRTVCLWKLSLPSLILHMSQSESVECGPGPITGPVDGVSGRRGRQVGFVGTNGWMH